MAFGWICISRNIQECDLWTDDEPFDRRSAWIDLLLMANHEDKKIIFDGNPVVVHRGQRITSIRKLSERWHWSRTKVTKFLDVLEYEERITRISDTKKTLLTIVKYDDYQSLDAEKSHRKATEKPQKSTNNNDNNENNDKSILSPSAKTKPERNIIPPTVEMVKAYCDQRRNGIDAQRFIDYYSTRGWMLGKAKMKDWQAAVRTWEGNQKVVKPNSMTQMMTNPTTDDDLAELERRLIAN